MFGYININRKELNREQEAAYRAYYCGLCHQLKSNYGKKGQVLLNYDMTFLVILLTGLYESETAKKEFVCGLHPLHKRKKWQNEITTYAADMNVLLAYYKLVDDWEDERKLISLSVANSLRNEQKKLIKKYPRQAKAIMDYLNRLHVLEKQKEENIDLVSGLTGEMLGELFAWKQDEWYAELRTLGYYMGKFIYLMDAYEDLVRDEKHGNYNPLLKMKMQDSNFEMLVKLMMTSMMSECAKSFERLPILLHAEIIRNILYSGVWTKYEYLQAKKRRKQDAKG